MLTPDPRRGKMNFEPFTGNARAMLAQSQVEAKKVSRNYIGCRELMAAILSYNDKCPIRGWLNSLGITYESHEEAFPYTGAEYAINPDEFIGFSPRTKRVIEQAFAEAVRFKHNYIDVSHILLALIDKRGGELCRESFFEKVNSVTFIEFVKENYPKAKFTLTLEPEKIYRDWKDGLKWCPRQMISQKKK